MARAARRIDVLDAEPPQLLMAGWLITPVEESRARRDVTVSDKASSFAKEIMLRPMLLRVDAQISNAVAAEAERA